MSNIETQHIKDRLANTLAIGASVIAASGALAPEIAVAHDSPAHTPAVEAYNFHGAHNESLPPAAETAIRRNTVYLRGLNCSGFLLRNDRDKVVGVLTAEHCSLTDQKNHRLRGSDGQRYIVQQEPVVAFTGAKKKTLKKAAEFDSFIVSDKYDQYHDLALGVAKGYQPEEVIQAYEKLALGYKDITNLEVGQKIYMGSWPVYQQHQTKLIERQSFALKLAGTGNVSMQDGKSNLDILWASVSSSNDAATCSYGASGSGAFTFIHGKLRLIGPLSVFNDLKGDVPRYPITGKNIVPGLKIKGQNISAVCGFGLQLDSVRVTGKVVHAVRSETDIPGYVSPEVAEQNARAEIKNNTVPKHYLDGSVQVFNSKGGASPVIENPLIVRHKNENVTVLAWADSTDPDHLSTVAIADEDLNQVLVYGNGPEQLPSFIETDATLNYQPPAEVPDSQTGKQSEAIEPVPLKGGPIPDNYADQGRFLNQAGTQLGYELPEIPSYTNGTYSLSVNDYSGDLDILPNVK